MPVGLSRGFRDSIHNSQQLMGLGGVGKGRGHEGKGNDVDHIGYMIG